MSENSVVLPRFKYHPDPIASGSLERTTITCVSCGQTRSYVYVGSVYANSDLESSICPWCISDGRAHEKFGAEFTDIDQIKDAPSEVKREVAFRTPGFNGWQQERWLAHCGDACAFLGAAGKAEIDHYQSEDLIESLRADVGMTDQDFHDYLGRMDKQSGPTAYVFRCLHCGRYQGYSDFY